MLITLSSKNISCPLEHNAAPRYGWSMLDSETQIAWRLFNLNWIPIAGMGVILLLAIAVTDFSLEPIAFGVTCAVAVALALTAYLHSFLGTGPAAPQLIFCLGAIAQILMVTSIAGPLSYVAGAANWPLQDHTLLSIDRYFGTDPEAIIRFVSRHHVLANILNSGYGAIKWPLLEIPIILAMTRRLVRLQQFVWAVCICIAATVMISMFVPAIGTYYGLGVSPSELPFVETTYNAQLRDILALRAGSLRHLELYKLAGIISFPSLHAASGILYVWALWPVRILRYFVAAIYAVMIASTPVTGAHYVIDVIGGIVVAVISIKLACRSSEILSLRPSIWKTLVYRWPSSSPLPNCAEKNGIPA
jgi:PAP2 superfamily